MKRNIFTQLKSWKVDSRRKPLILMGPRQVGKTYSLQAFGAECYRQVIYLNFETSPQLANLFDGSLSAKDLLKALSIELEVEIIPGDTLIIFDEVQECPNALTSLKYFNEEANEFHIIAAGSLLGIQLANGRGFPVGKVDFMSLSPLSFSEFLGATGQELLLEFFNDVSSIELIPANLHEKLLEFYKTYLYVGGMPEAVVAYRDTNDFMQVRKVQQAVLMAYNLDFAKHAPAHQGKKISQVWENIPSQLAKENKKFIYSVLRKGARASEFEIAIQWLQDAGLIHKVYNIAIPQLPLKAHANPDFFKIYLSDVGLLAAMVDLSPKVLLHGNDVFKEFKGSLVENYIAQALKAQAKDLYYWTSEGKAEVDFVISHDDKIYPVEIKAGNNKKKQSLRVYDDLYQPQNLIRCSTRNLKKDAKVLNCPLYMLEKLLMFIEAS